MSTSLAPSSHPHRALSETPDHVIDTMDDGPTTTSTSSSSSSSSTHAPSASSSSSSSSHARRRPITPAEMDAIPLAGEGGLFPSDTFVGRCLIHFNCGLQDLRLLFMVLPCLAIVLFVTHQLLAGLIMVFLTVLMTCGISYRLLLLLRSRHLHYNELSQDMGGLGLAHGGGGGFGRSMGGLHYSQLMAMSSRNPTALRLAMMDRDFTPNDYEELLRLDEEARAQTFNGCPASVIERFPTFKIPPHDPSHPQKAQQCAVCLEDKVEGQTVRALICLHSFHDDCITPWLRQSKKCPVCQFDQMSA